VAQKRIIRHVDFFHFLKFAQFPSAASDWRAAAQLSVPASATSRGAWRLSALGKPECDF
jgi:hypothetical protein